MILFQKDRLKEFFPIKEMNNIEKLNALFRLSIYLGILLTVITQNYMYLYIIIVTGVCLQYFYMKIRKKILELYLILIIRNIAN